MRPIPLVPERGPRRPYALSVLVTMFGFGLVMTATPLYATRIVGLSARQVGVGMTIAGLIGLLAAVPMGDLADRRGPREVVRAAILVQAAAAACFIVIHGFAEFVVVTTVSMLAMNAGMSADGALLRRLGGEEASAFRASTQAITNVGISVGAVGCGVALQLSTPAAYRALFAGNALTLIASWAILRRLPRYEPLPKPDEGPRWAALADRPFVAYTVLAGFMFIEYMVTVLLLPLWVVDHTHAPRWTVSLFLLINTVLVVLFQVRVGSRVRTVPQGGTALRRAGAIFLVSCSAMGFAAGLPGWAALLLLAAAVTVHTFGELWHSSAIFALDFGLPPEHAQGQYQGLAGIGTGAGQAAAPVLLIGLCLSLGQAGWVGLGACFALVGLTAPALAAWGARTRAAQPAPPAPPAPPAAPAPPRFDAAEFDAPEPAAEME
jgi:MFS family permease